MVWPQGTHLVLLAQAVQVAAHLLIGDAFGERLVRLLLACRMYPFRLNVKRLLNKLADEVFGDGLDRQCDGRGNRLGDGGVDNL